MVYRVRYAAYRRSSETMTMARGKGRHYNRKDERSMPMTAGRACRVAQPIGLVARRSGAATRHLTPRVRLPRSGRDQPRPQHALHPADDRARLWSAGFDNALLSEV